MVKIFQSTCQNELAELGLLHLQLAYRVHIVFNHEIKQLLNQGLEFLRWVHVVLSPQTFPVTPKGAVMSYTALHPFMGAPG